MVGLYQASNATETISKPSVTCKYQAMQKNRTDVRATLSSEEISDNL